MRVQSWLGCSAVNSLLTRSRGRSATSAGIVVFTARSRTAPRSPSSFISRSTVHRATIKPSRLSCLHTFRTPNTWKFASQTRLTSTRRCSSRRQRVERSAGSVSRAFQRFYPVWIIGNRSVLAAQILLVLTNPAAKRLACEANVFGNRLNGSPLRSVTVLVVEHHANSPLSDF